VLLVLAFSLIVPLQPAAAGGPTEAGRISQLVEQVAAADDPHAAFADLPERDRLAVRSFLTVTRYVDSVSSPTPSAVVGLVSIARSGCWTWTWRRDGHNVFGWLIWSYFQQINWCGNGSVITSPPQRTRWGEVHAPFWSWRHIGNQTWGGVNQASYRAWTQGEFKLCLPLDLGCSYRYPWLDMTAWADGRGTGNVGG
jgi:hypothetical protein